MIASADGPLRIGEVALTVHDLDGVSRFYQEAIGLHQLAGDKTVARLGAGATVLLELRRDAQARVRSPREAGLFHTAFLLPTRADLGRWLRHAAETRVAIEGASDHGVSEAIYLADPEGNGIEIYADRAPSGWAWSGGMIAMKTDPLDLDDLIRSAPPGRWEGLAPGTIVGHVHLQVGAIAPADAFYVGLLGFDRTAAYPGASFFGSGGYHHHLAANIWNSRNASVRTEPTTGLSDIEIIAADPARLAAIVARAGQAGVAVEGQASRVTLRDPWGTKLTLTDRRM